MKRFFLFSLLFCLACGSDDASPTPASAAGAGGSAGGAGGAAAGAGGAVAGAGGAAGVGGDAGGAAGDGGMGGEAGAGDAGMGGDAGSGGAGEAGAGGSAGAFVLESEGVKEGGVFPADFTCGGANESPPLAWGEGPAGTASYAIVFTDTSNNLVHWILWDIAPQVHSVPKALENKANPSTPAGAKQPRSYDNQTYGYLGPCPGGKEHIYRFAIHALDVAELPGVTTSSSRPQIAKVVEAHTLSKATLTAKSSAPK